MEWSSNVDLKQEGDDCDRTHLLDSIESVRTGNPILTETNSSTNFVPYEMLQNAMDLIVNLNSGCPQEPNLDFAYDTLVSIFKHLNWTELKQCSKVNSKWYEASLNPRLYRDVTLKSFRFTEQIADFDWLIQRCQFVQKFKYVFCEETVFYKNCLSTLNTEELAEQKSTLSRKVSNFLQQCCRQLFDLKLQYLDENLLEDIAKCTKLTKLCLKGAYFRHDSNKMYDLLQLNKLVTLHFHQIKLTSKFLKNLLADNPSLKHFKLNECVGISVLDTIVKKIAEFNTKITSIEFYKSGCLKTLGVEQLANCKHLKKLGLEKTSILQFGISIDRIAAGCPNLLQLEIRSWDTSEFNQLYPVIYYLRKLTNLNISFCENFCEEEILSETNNFCRHAFEALPKLDLQLKFSKKFTLTISLDKMVKRKCKKN